METKKQATARRVIYIAILVVASLPLACGYVMEGGDILLWLARVEEVKDNLQARYFLLYPSSELIVAYEGQFSALNSNLWLLIPAIIRILGGSITTSYRLYLLFLNMITMLTVHKMFGEIFEKKVPVLFGVLFYMTCPYRIYICYDKANLGMVAAWTLIPLVVGGMVRLFRTSITWKNVVMIAVAFAAVGYADGILLLFLSGIIILGVIWYRKPQGLIPLVSGLILYLPGATCWLSYLMVGGMEEWNLPIRSIAGQGYALGQFFSTWTYRLGCPGLGLGLMCGLAFYIWPWLAENSFYMKSHYTFFTFVMCFLALLSLECFPWDMVQRLGTPFLRLVSLMETQGFCFGFTSLAACVPAACGVERMIKHQRYEGMVGVALAVVFAAIGVAIYICNSLTYYRVPMFLTEFLPM